MATRSPAGSPVDAVSSLELLARVRAGDSYALNALCSRYLPRLQRWAHGRLPQWARGALDTQDIVQDALIHVLGRVEKFEPRHEAAFQAYVRQALHNRICDVIRAARHRPPAELLDSAVAADEPSPLEQAIGREAVNRYEAALNRLRPTERQAIILRFELGMSNAEVAAALGKRSEAAANMTISRALVRLASEMSRAAAPERSTRRKASPGEASSPGGARRHGRRR